MKLLTKPKLKLKENTIEWHYLDADMQSVYFHYGGAAEYDNVRILIEDEKDLSYFVYLINNPINNCTIKIENYVLFDAKVVLIEDDIIYGTIATVQYALF